MSQENQNAMSSLEEMPQLRYRRTRRKQSQETESCNTSNENSSSVGYSSKNMHNTHNMHSMPETTNKLSSQSSRSSSQSCSDSFYSCDSNSRNVSGADNTACDSHLLNMPEPFNVDKVEQVSYCDWVLLGGESKTYKLYDELHQNYDELVNGVFKLFQSLEISSLQGKLPSHRVIRANKLFYLEQQAYTSNHETWDSPLVEKDTRRNSFYKLDQERFAAECPEYSRKEY